MLKNTMIKKILKGTVFPVISAVNLIIPKRNDYILLHGANMGISHNLAPLRDYLLREGYDKHNRIVCEVESLKYAEPEYNVEYVTFFKAVIFFLRARHVFYTTGQIPVKPSKKQIVIHLDHGAAGFKSFGALSNIHNGKEFYFTYYMAPSELYVPIAQKAFLCPKENIKINDEPVADVLLTLNVKYDLGNCKCIGIWMPTFRQSKYLGYSDSTEKNLLPLFETSKYCELNDVLKKYDIKLIVKIHSGQNLESVITGDYSNLLILTEEDMRKKGWGIYPLMAQMDFLISDYSSAYLQYLLLDRPVSFVVPDFNEYINTRGSVFENPKDFMPGDFITGTNEFYQFLEKMSKGIDDHGEERRSVCGQIHKYQDARNCERVVEISEIKKSY